MREIQSSIFISRSISSICPSLKWATEAGLERHRLVGILTMGERLMTGERIYGSERALRLMLGPVFDELEPF